MRFSNEDMTINIRPGIFTEDELVIAEKISRRRRQILVHSIIYYKFNESLISDIKWSDWAIELEELQKKYPEIAEKCCYSDAFRDFDHSTGYNLPLLDAWANKEAQRLVNYAKGCC